MTDSTMAALRRGRHRHPAGPALLTALALLGAAGCGDSGLEPAPDAGSAGRPDTGPRDVGAGVDTGPRDEGTSEPDTGAHDSGHTDAAPRDAGLDDGGAVGSFAVSVTIAPAVVTEVPASEVAFTLALDRDPPPAGVRIYMRGDVDQSLTQLDLFTLRVDPASNDAPVGDLDFSGFTLLLRSRQVTVRLAGFADGVAEAPIDVSYRVIPFDEVPWGMPVIMGEPSTVPYVVSIGTAVLRFQDAP